jgi:hypothetical protein
MPLFSGGGGDDNGALRDATLDIGKDTVLAPGSTASFVSYQTFGMNIASAESYLIGNLAKAPLRFFTPQRLAGGNLQLLAAASDGSPITAERASRIQLYSSTNASLSLNNWTPVTVQTILNNGVLQINGLTVTNAPARFFRAVELP